MAYEEMVGSLQTNVSGFLGSLLEGVIAFCIFFIIMFVGVGFANILGKALRIFFKELRLENFLEKHGVHDAFLGFTFTDISAAILKLYVAVAFLGIAADVVRVEMLSHLAMQAIGYLPSLVQGIVILLAGLIAGDYITDRIKTSKSIPFANSLAVVIEVFIAYNALVIAMPLLLPAADPSLLIWSFLVVLSAFALALGLGAAIAIGLGLKDTVADIAKKHKSKLDRLL
ncbi:MAG: hypothetical protein N3F07_04225 [Candidatus Micrarchaeota archaeon]|nr:hypothetical protein [Candidatus Micrarchaeota archaeon]